MLLNSQENKVTKQKRSKTDKLDKLNWRQVLLISYLVAIVVMSILLYLSMKNQPAIPYKEIDATNKAIERLKQDLLDSQRRIDDLDKRVREQIKEIKCVEQSNVSAMDSDDVANALQDELGKFRAD